MTAAADEMSWALPGSADESELSRLGISVPSAALR